MASKRAVRPSIRELVELADDTSLSVVSRAKVAGKTVLGSFDGEKITVGLEGHRKTGKADQLVQTLIHELIHAHDETHTEEQIKSWEWHYFKNPELREAVLIKLVNCVLFNYE